MTTEPLPEKLDLLRDGKPVAEDITSMEALAYVHRNHPYSLDHALKYEGFQLVPHVGDAPKVHPFITDPDSITHFICGSGVLKTGDPETTHHMNNFNRCAHCGKDAAQLRKELGL